MGLCKCPKKRVTQQFCFEHRVNVCEFCMVDNHTTCVVNSYLQWLEDSSYKSVCSFCQISLNTKECIRLLCYHIFHWTCLNKYYSSLPTNTAPGGYTCPDCNCSIFPSNNIPTPIYTVLKKKLAGEDWARIGLCLPINSVINKSQEIKNDLNVNENLNIQNTLHQSFELKEPASSNIIVYHTQNNLLNSESIPVAINNVANHFSNNYINNSINTFNTSSRKIINNSYPNETHSLIVDIDEDKYRQRSKLERIFRYLKFQQYEKNFYGFQKWIILGVVLFILVFFFLYFFIQLGRQNAENDPLLDPKYNPNIHVEENFNNFE